MTGPVICAIALRVASRGDSSGSSLMTRSTFSTTTIASSTTTPMPRTIASSESYVVDARLAVQPGGISGSRIVPDTLGDLESETVVVLLSGRDIVREDIEVVQAQESVVGANETLISSTLQFNLAKLALARSLGVAERATKEFLGGKP